MWTSLKLVRQQLGSFHAPPVGIVVAVGLTVLVLLLRYVGLLLKHDCQVREIESVNLRTAASAKASEHHMLVQIAAIQAGLLTTKELLGKEVSPPARPRKTTPKTKRKAKKKTK